jgi:hypothetical protein
MDDALNWLKENNVTSGNLDDDSIATLSRISAMVPGALGKDPSDVAETMEHALHGLRCGDKTKDVNIDDSSVAAKKSRTAVPENNEEVRVKEMLLALLFSNLMTSHSRTMLLQSYHSERCRQAL